MAVSGSSRSKKVVYAALLGNLMVAVIKLTAALLTGSSSMLSESAHSFVDTGNEALLLYGYYRSRLAPDQTHPLGYGRELYFWSFVVALLLFALGAGISIYEGITRIGAPSRIENIAVNYIVLALSAAFEGASWWIALVTFRAVKGRPQLLGSNQTQQGSALFHGTSGRYRSHRNFDRCTGHLPFGSARKSGRRRRCLDPDRRHFGGHGTDPRAREQGTADRRACARGNHHVDPCTCRKSAGRGGRKRCAHRPSCAGSDCSDAEPRVFR